MLSEKEVPTDAVPVSELGIEQLNSLQKQLEQEINFFGESLLELKKCEEKFAASEAAVAECSKMSENDEMLVPLTESIYIPACAEDPSQVLVDIGTGYFAEMKTDKAVNIFKRKQEYLKEQMGMIEKILSEKQQTQSIITESLSEKICEAGKAAVPNSGDVAK